MLWPLRGRFLNCQAELQPGSSRAYLFGARIMGASFRNVAAFATPWPFEVAPSEGRRMRKNLWLISAKGLGIPAKAGTANRLCHLAKRLPVFQRPQY